MAITLDRLGSRYGLLPSHVVRQASTFDLQVLDIALSYEAYMDKKSRGELPDISQETMEHVLKEVRKDD